MRESVPGGPGAGLGDQGRTWQLSEMDLFADLSAEEMRRIADAAPMREVRRGALLYGPHRPVEVLFILKKGRVRLYRTAVDGRSLTTAILTPGQLFGDMAPLGQRMDHTYAEMLEPGVICLMSRGDVQRLLFTDLRIVARIADLLGARIAELERRLSDTVLKPVPARICSALATLAGSPPAPVRLTHEQLADLVGTTRETTTKVLGDLRGRHLIQVRRARIDVVDPDRLIELATSPTPW
ncbi:MAG: Crp/Fnr family transcriptional regulator [Actinobacteria bacterium]|nr:Crp/Fnr family transcriptional regulator [Actinomycetota bacterium]